MRALVTGCNGQLGRALRAELAADEVDPWAVPRQQLRHAQLTLRVTAALAVASAGDLHAPTVRRLCFPTVTAAFPVGGGSHTSRWPALWAPPLVVAVQSTRNNAAL